MLLVELVGIPPTSCPTPFFGLRCYNLVPHRRIELRPIARLQGGCLPIRLSVANSLVQRVGFEPTMDFRHPIMSRGPATNTASVAKHNYLKLFPCCLFVVYSSTYFFQIWVNLG